MNLNTTLTLFDQLNAQDPNTEINEGKQIAKELLYSRRMSARLKVFNPSASELLQLAVHAQHIERWKSPRSDYPDGRVGYLKWRQELGQFHAQCASRVMTEQGYSDGDCARVRELLQKKNLKRDTEMQCLEDVICLVFIEHYLLNFVQKHSAGYSEEKLFKIVQKAWNKMSPAGQAAALLLPLDKHLFNIIKSALGI
jgi:hypothetical protein|tara:strand:+ start:392 stop:982 length:591 start_codon:yes stop_codon:yes gene_type:complete